MDKTEYLKMLKEQSETNSKTMSDTARTIGFAIIGLSIGIHSNVNTTKLTYLFLILVLLFFIIDFFQYLFMWQSSKKLFLSVKAEKIDGKTGDGIDKKNKKLAFILVVLKLFFLASSLLVLGYVMFKHILS